MRKQGVDNTTTNSQPASTSAEKEIKTATLGRSSVQEQEQNRINSSSLPALLLLLTLSFSPLFEVTLCSLCSRLSPSSLFHSNSVSLSLSPLFLLLLVSSQENKKESKRVRHKLLFSLLLYVSPCSLGLQIDVSFLLSLFAHSLNLLVTLSLFHSFTCSPPPPGVCVCFACFPFEFFSLVNFSNHSEWCCLSLL
ncbi:MAG: hypothetical protein J3R72DRAFT_200760 [Linnemannia gamsii]|nr:MAG: hypothetical protein J3R72DRAFT_200760 [Linnemannia gamsii]